VLEHRHDEIREIHLKLLYLGFKYTTIGENSLMSIVNDVLVLSADGHPQLGIGNDG
jgi:hypothetical protein